MSDTGSVKVNWQPLLWFLAIIVPLWAVIIVLQMESPMPIPLELSAEVLPV